MVLMRVRCCVHILCIMIVSLCHHSSLLVVWIFSIVVLITWFLYSNRRYRWIYILYKTLPRDLKAVYRGGRLAYKLLCMKMNNETVPTIFTKVVKKHPNKIALFYENEAWTYQQLEDFSNKIANYFIARGYTKGDNVALLLDNRPEYAAIWLGLSKAGIVTAFINTNLKLGPLHHSISAAKCKAVIFGSDFVDAVDGIKLRLEGTELFHFHKSESAKEVTGVTNLWDQIQNQSKTSPTRHISQVDINDTVVLIYTSGTTGLPKAARISHSRYIFATTGLYVLTNLEHNDIYYNPMPLYHGSGGMISLGQSLCFGLSVVLRKKFSASNFWTDCVKYDCTVSTYVGELCRYLLLAHKNGKVVNHGVKKMVGNGLRKEIWADFMNTFNISEIYEFYGSTEGNANLINLDNTIGAIGFIPPLSRFIYPVTIIRCDDETYEPLRNHDGFCIRCEPGEVGILLGRINRTNVISDFSGYTDKKETSKKIISNVFKNGDSYFNSGDLMVKDELGYVYFKDRTGDTYRWKGENVATTEVESVASEVIGATDVVVYGVQVPGSEGRAGMIAIADPEKSINLDDLANGLKSHLPAYAIPLFLRILDSLPVTGTFKVKKVELKKDGFDVRAIKDPLFFFDAKKGVYIPLGHVFEDILNQKLKL